MDSAAHLVIAWVLPLSLGWMLALVVHELGHAVAGRLAGLSVAAVGVGLERVNRVTLFGCRLFAGFGDTVGGLTLFVPRRWNTSPRRLAVATAGGPAANLVLAVVAGFGIGGRVGWCLAAVSLLCGLVALVPQEFDSPVGRLVSDGLSLRRYLRGEVPPTARAVAYARLAESYRRLLGEPRLLALYSDLAAIEWTLLGAEDAARRCRAEADAVRPRWRNRLERAVEVLAAGVAARVTGEGAAAAERMAEVRRLGAGDPVLVEHATAILSEGRPGDPWFECWWFRRAAAVADPTTGVELYAEAVRAAFEPAGQFGDHTEDWAAFVDATDRLLRDFRRAVRAAGGDPRQATRELLTPIYARRTAAASLPAAVPTPAPHDPVPDRRRWRAGLALGGSQLLVGLGLLGVVATAGVQTWPALLRLCGLTGFAAVAWSLAPLLAAGLLWLPPGSRPGRGDAGRVVLALAVGAVGAAAVQAALTARLAFVE
jgi:hypothetical protein